MDPTKIAIFLFTSAFVFTLAPGFVHNTERCSALESQSGLECTTSTGLVKNCSLPQEIGTEVKCKPFYLPRNGDTVSVCGTDGQWTVPEFTCQIDCGRFPGSKYKQRPFHAVILQAVKKNHTVKICSGSLIDESLILTTRHCLVGVKGNVLEPYELFVQLGNAIDASDFSLARPVKELYLLPMMSPNTTSNATDLAIIRLEKEVEFSAEVLPVCLPGCEQTESMALRDGSFGEVMSKGKPEKFVIELSEECRLHNMVCAGREDSAGTPLCQEETGLGITVAVVDNIHFLQGVLSNEHFKSCKQLRPFKRVYPYIRWIKSVMDYSAEPYVSLLEDEDYEPTPKFECPDSDEGKTKDWFREISEARQRKSSALVINDKKVRTCDLLNSLRSSSNLKTLSLTYVTLTTGFQEKVTLPKLTHFRLQTLETIKAVNFTDFFPFYKKDGSAWKTRDIANLGIDIVIENGINFELHPEQGIIVIKNIGIADEVLRGANPAFKLRSLTIQKSSVSIRSIPSTVRRLSLYEPTITDGTVTDVLQKLDQLDSLSLSFDTTHLIPVELLPLKTLKTLIIGKVNLTSIDPWGLIGYPVFQKLDTLYINTDYPAFDNTTQIGFLDIFKTCKYVGYFGNDDFGFIRTILKLTNLVELTIRVQGPNTDPDVVEFFKEFNFNLEGIDKLDVVKFVKIHDGFKVEAKKPSWELDEVEPDSEEF